MHSYPKINLVFPIHYILPLIILLEGFVSIGIEMLTIRQLLPVAGGSVIVTSFIIGFFLLFLALGYKKGGKLTENIAQRLRFNFTFVAIWLGIGLSYIFVESFFYYIQKITGDYVFYPLIAYLLLILSPMIYILGQTIPITMNLVKQDQAAGVIGGNTLGLSTLGSFLGSLLSTLLLMQYFGVAWTVFINSALLLFLILMLNESFASLIIYLCTSIVIALITYSINIYLENKLFLLTDNYANYYIADSHNSELKPEEKILSINDSFSSFIDSNKKGFPYVEIIKKILFKDLKIHHQEILVLGAGGFSLSAENSFHNHFTYIDIDKRIKQVTIPKFLDHIEGKLIVDDARHFLTMKHQKYDVIISDAYTNRKYLPAHLLTQEYMSVLKKSLAANGIVIFNIIGNPTLSDPYSKRIDNTIRSVFANCMVLPEQYKNDITNILYICHQENGIDHRVYTDNLNTSTTDALGW